MFHKISPAGYFGGVQKISRGPWFKEYLVEDDGLDWFYQVFDYDGTVNYLLSNNMPMKDREQLQSLYWTQYRNSKISTWVAMYLSFEACARFSCFKGMAIGWKALSWCGMSYVAHHMLMAYQAQFYGPLFSAHLRKYKQFIK